MKNNTNMLSDPEDEIRSVDRKLSNFNPLIFERNHSKDHEDTAKSSAMSNNYAI